MLSIMLGVFTSYEMNIIILIVIVITTIIIIIIATSIYWAFTVYQVLCYVLYIYCLI